MSEEEHQQVVWLSKTYKAQRTELLRKALRLLVTVTIARQEGRELTWRDRTGKAHQPFPTL